MARKESLFDNILDNSVNTGLKTNFQNAIVNAGVKIPASTGLWEYPEIIRKNLVNKTITGINILGHDVINIDTVSDGNILTYNLSTKYNTHGVDRPNYAKENSQWNKNFTVKDIFDDLFGNILPAVRGVYAGDMTISNMAGEDTQDWHNELFNQTGRKTGLEQSTRYIRLYLTCQAEPIYINIGSLIEEITNGYNVVSSDTVTFEIDDSNNVLKAHINVINDNQLQELGIINTDDVLDALMENYNYNSEQN